MKKILICLVILLCANITNAAEWVEIGYKTYADLSSYKKEGNYASAWFKTLSIDNTETLDGKRVWYRKINYKANCSNKTINLLYGVAYDLKEKVINHVSFPDIKSYYDPVVPETVGETYYNALCR